MDSLYDLLLPIQWVVAWIMYGCHWLLETLGMSATGGVT